MALPDRFEQVGVLLGSVLLVGLPVSELVGAVYGVGLRPWVTLLAWLLPGLAVGALLVAGRLPLTYHQVWVLSLTSWVFAFLCWSAVGVSIPATDLGIAVGVWLVAVALGTVVAWCRPVAVVRHRLGRA